MSDRSEVKEKVLMDQLEYYKTENARMESLFKRLRIPQEELKDRCNGLDKLLKHSSDVRDLNINTLRLSQAEQSQKHRKYVSQLGICIKFYINLNEALSKELEMAKLDLAQSKIDINGTVKISSQELHQLDEKVKKYESEFLKFEKKYPWLKDRDYDLPNMAKEVETLKILQDERDKLLKDLSVYQELKPDIREATEQLNQLKLQHKNFYNSVFHI